ncbi:FAD/NAD(P)-binding domain-containing protein [Pararhizobium sp. LjRoot255]|uniref:FAD/NAD(P)-binding protein n=1 Tax=Pararhizobium sp. LjRoot255 TaxID=3342298 RepID=UPI003ECD7742
MGRLESGLIVAIVGGGFSGAAVAAHLAQHAAFGDGRIVVFEPREHLGRGLAYDTENDAHRVNVPAGRMSLALDDDDHFLDWLERNGEIAKDRAALAEDGNLYPRRGVFGRYVSDYVQPFVLCGVVRHERSRVISVLRRGAGWLVLAENGRQTLADILVVATSHPAPHAPESLDRALTGHPRYIPDATVPDALAAIRPHDRVLVVGAGLTSADIVATLDQRGHSGPITLFSRRGLRSRGHATAAQEPFGDFSSERATTALELLRRVRAAIRAAASQGVSWHAVFDALRAQGGHIWRRLPILERRRLVRHLRPFWDVHRFRIAPQLEQVIDRGLSSGRLRLLAASIVDVVQSDDAISISLRRRGRGEIDRSSYDAVVVTTGPAHGGILASQGWLSEMEKTGVLKLDDTGLGVACNDESRAIDQQGQTNPDLFISGPLARGTFGELMGLPQVNEHAMLVANGIALMAASASPSQNLRRAL